MKTLWLRLVLAAFIPAVLAGLAPYAWAQSEGLGNTTSTPVAGVPHDYITSLNEIVNPANGALSIRIPQPYPHERNPNWPRYAFKYDSNRVYSIQPGWTPVAHTNWQNLTSLGLTNPPGVGSFSTGTLHACTDPACPPPADLSCTYANNYTVVDPEGGVHALGLQWLSDPNGDCGYWGMHTLTLQGGDERYKAVITGPGNPEIWDLQGNTPTLDGRLQEDVNGNYSDTTGRAAPLPTPYTTGHTSFSQPTAVFSVTPMPGGNCAISGNTIAAYGSSVNPITTVNLPNGQTYTFEYALPYRLLSKITYPTGAKVEYTWNTFTNQEGVHYSAVNNGTDTTGICDLRHNWFAISKRIVYLNSSTQTQEQDFAYTTHFPSPSTPFWDTKQTVVTTKDLLRGTQFKTVL